MCLHTASRWWHCFGRLSGGLADSRSLGMVFGGYQLLVLSCTILPPGPGVKQVPLQLPCFPCCDRFWAKNESSSHGYLCQVWLQQRENSYHKFLLSQDIGLGHPQISLASMQKSACEAKGSHGLFYSLTFSPLCFSPGAFIT